MGHFWDTFFSSLFMHLNRENSRGDIPIVIISTNSTHKSVKTYLQDQKKVYGVPSLYLEIFPLVLYYIPRQECPISLRYPFPSSFGLSRPVHSDDQHQHGCRAYYQSDRKSHPQPSNVESVLEGCCHAYWDTYHVVARRWCMRVGENLLHKPLTFSTYPIRLI